MKELTLPELIQILQECAGVDEEGELVEGEAGDTTFEDLGYDSLALLETGARVERRFAVKLPEEELGTVRTPRQFVTLVNACLTPVVRGAE